MTSRCCVLAAAIITAWQGAASIAIAEPPLEVPVPGASTACVWTGKEMLLWTGVGHALALDPEKNVWRAVATDPYPGRIVQQELLRLSDGSVLATYWAIGEKTRLCFDRYFPNNGQWRRMAFVKYEDFKSDMGKPYENFPYTMGKKEYVAFPLEISGMAALTDGAVVFIASDLGGEAVKGLRVKDSGAVRFISCKDACPQSYGRADTAVYSFGGKVLYFGYSRVDTNTWGVWDEKTDTWSKPQAADRRYSFGHCQAGDEVYVFGGAESSAFGWIKRDGAVYSFTENRWRPLPVENGPSGRRDFSMCWTGKELLVWGGQVLLPGCVVPEREKGAVAVSLSAVMAFDPARRQWRAILAPDGPAARAYCSTVWTGKDMIVWGGELDSCPRKTFDDGYAFDPAAGRWRKLPNVPKSLVPATRTRPVRRQLKSRGVRATTFRDQGTSQLTD